ncbi:MAG: DUF3987 domain-containing protein [Roseobacter sp.]
MQILARGGQTGAQLIVSLNTGWQSPALDAVLDPIREIESQLAAQCKDARHDWQAHDEIAKLNLAKWKADAKAATENVLPAPEKPKKADAGHPPVRGRVRIADATTEKFGEFLRDGWRGLLLSRDELSGWLGPMDGYCGGNDRPFWLEAFVGRSYSVDRKNSLEPIIIDHLSVSILGSTQPDTLDSQLVRSDDDGLLARFLIVYAVRARQSHAEPHH